MRGGCARGGGGPSKIEHAVDGAVHHADFHTSRWLVRPATVDGCLRRDAEHHGTMALPSTTTTASVAQPCCPPGGLLCWQHPARSRRSRCSSLWTGAVLHSVTSLAHLLKVSPAAFFVYRNRGHTLRRCNRNPRTLYLLFGLRGLGFGFTECFDWRPNTYPCPPHCHGCHFAPPPPP